MSEREQKFNDKKSKRKERKDRDLVHFFVAYSIYYCCFLFYYLNL